MVNKETETERCTLLLAQRQLCTVTAFVTFSGHDSYFTFTKPHGTKPNEYDPKNILQLQFCP